LRHVPGRKSDVQDAEWGCQLVEHGLVRTSFVPPRPLRELRDLLRRPRISSAGCRRCPERPASQARAGPIACPHGMKDGPVA
jgi:hypothetical protein